MYRKLLKNSFIYILGDVLNKSIPFFMLPVLTRYLTPEDYGMISVFTAFVAILAVFTGLSVHGAVNVNFFRISKDELREYIGNVIVILNVTTLSIFLFVLIFQSFLQKKLNLPTEWLFIAVVLAFTQFITTINLVLWTAEQRPKPYTFYQLAQTLVTTGLSLILIVAYKMNWEGQLIAQSSGIILFAGISVIFLYQRKYLIFKINRNYINDALKFGIPLIPHSLAAWIKTGADRLILMSLVGSFATGIYSVAYQLGMIVSVLVTAFNKAWSPHIFKMLSSGPTYEEKKKTVKFIYMYFACILLFSVLFAYLAKYLLPLFLVDQFKESVNYIIYFSLAFAFQGMYLMVGNYIIYEKKTSLLAYVTLSTAILHISLTFLFVSYYGAVGAAMSTVISYLVTFFAIWLLSAKVYKMPWLLGEEK
jgi:O-antigen/teichoic acid export membrane protein